MLDIRQGGADVVDTLPWLGAIVAGIYVGFYTRFSSQWAYLANLYNQIIQTEIAMPSEEDEVREARLAAWKAGFIEDAEDLHLATKPLFVMAVLSWAKEDAVASAYGQNTIGGPERLHRLIARLEQIADPHASERSHQLLMGPLAEGQELSGHA